MSDRQPTKTVLQIWSVDTTGGTRPTHVPDALERWASRDYRSPGDKDTLALAHPDEPWIALGGVPPFMNFGVKRRLGGNQEPLQMYCSVEAVPTEWRDWQIQPEDTAYTTVCCIKGNASGMRCLRWSFKQTAVCRCYLLDRDCVTLEAGRCRFNRIYCLGNDPNAGQC